MGKRNFLFFLLVMFAILVLNSLHASYPDEFDNILGGKLILQGILPYTGFFSHHGPIAYFLSGILILFSGQSFVKFRLLSAVFFTLLFMGSYLIIKKRVSNFNPNYILILLLAIAFSSTFFWGQMFLADPLSGYLLVPAYALLFLKTFYGEKLEIKDLSIISLFSALSVLNSMTYLYAAIFIALVTFLGFIKQSPKSLRDIAISALRFTIIFAGPYLVFLIYLLATGSFGNFYSEAIQYNQKYYIYNYPRPAGSTTLNPIRYAVVILMNFINTYQPLLAGLQGTNFRFPLTAAIAVTNACLWIYLAIKKKWLLLILSFLTIVYVNARGNPGDLRAGDYQMAVYFIISLFNGIFLFSVLSKEKILAPLIWILGLFWFFGTMFIGADFFRMNYSRYMGEMPLIYDRPNIAPVINSVVPKNHYCWSGPFEFEEMFYLNCKTPSKYHWILPQFAQIDYIKAEIIADYSKNRADIIAFNRNFSAFMQSSSYSDFFVDFLNKNYIRLRDLPKYKNYQFKSNRTRDYNLDEVFNFKKDIAVELISSLIEKGYIEEIK